jgi:hypothetical protein
MKRFSTIDAGNTWLSTLYFSQTKDLLPEEAQKTAASRLLEACQHFDIEPPDFLAELSGAESLSTNFVDVTDAPVPTRVLEKTASQEDTVYAIERADGSRYYPLQDASSVQVASEYFERSHKNFVPRERREFAVKVASVARKGSLPVSSAVQAYAGTDYCPEVEGCIGIRYLHIRDKNDAVSEAELRKIASSRESVSPDVFAQALEDFDRASGLDALWDRWVPDPWLSTYGMQKLAKGTADAVPMIHLPNGISVSPEDLKNFAVRNKGLVAVEFGAEFATKFESAPIQLFNSLPTPQKQILAKMATSASDST